jgi:hypothetical protein
LNRTILSVIIGVVVIGLCVAGYFLVDHLSQPTFDGPKKSTAAPAKVVNQMPGLV